MKDRPKQRIKADQEKQCKNQNKTSGGLKWLFRERKGKTLHLWKENCCFTKGTLKGKNRLLEIKNVEQKCKISTQGIEVKETF